MAPQPFIGLRNSIIWLRVKSLQGPKTQMQAASSLWMSPDWPVHSLAYHLGWRPP